MNNPLQQEFRFYIEHQDEMVKKYDGKFIVIKDGLVLGALMMNLLLLRKPEKLMNWVPFWYRESHPVTPHILRHSIPG